MEMPKASDFPGTGAEGNGILTSTQTRDEYLYTMKGCLRCHQVGNEWTRGHPSGEFTSTMRERLQAKGAPPDRLRVIPNWVDTRAITPQPRDNEWAGQHDLVSKFVVMHSGNVGHAQDLDSLVRAATFLRDRDDVQIVVATALHRRMTADEIRRMVGERVFRSFWPKDLYNFDGEDKEAEAHVAEEALDHPERREPEHDCERESREGKKTAGDQLTIGSAPPIGDPPRRRSPLRNGSFTTFQPMDARARKTLGP